MAASLQKKAGKPWRFQSTCTLQIPVPITLLLLLFNYFNKVISVSFLLIWGLSGLRRWRNPSAKALRKLFGYKWEFCFQTSAWFTRSDQPCVLAWRCCPVTATEESSWRRRRGGLALRPAAEHWSSRSAPAQTAARRGTAATLGRKRCISEQLCRWHLVLYVITVKS